MTPKEIWDWIDALASLPVEERMDDFIREWDNALLEEITQGRAIIAHVIIDGSVMISKENEHVRIHGCTFNAAVKESA